MFSILKEIRYCPQCTKINYFFTLQIHHRFVSSSNDPQTLSDESVNNEIPSSLSENISRLPADVYRHFKGLPPLEIRERYHTRERLRSLYGKYGRKTGIDVKLCWPTQEEMDEIIDDEKVYNMELKEKLKIVKERKDIKQKEIDQIQAKIEKNLKNMPKMITDYQARAIDRQIAEKAELKVKNDLAEQARDFYGFSVDPNDERMQFMLLQLEEKQKVEEKKQRKALKTQQAAQQLQEMMGITETTTADGQTAMPAGDKQTDMKLFAKLVTEKTKLAKAASKLADEAAQAQKGKKR